jgi:tetratricopeptide (TPR) repeat protein
LILIMLLATASCGPLAEGGEEASSETERSNPETKDRLTPEEMDRMVEGPMLSVRSGNLARGGAEFWQLLRRSQGAGRDARLKTADLHSAFGVGLYSEAKNSEDRRLADAAITHLRTAVAEYERAFGPRHPEVALAVTTLADGMAGLAGGRWLPERIPMYRRALSIRVEKLGVRNIETVASMVDLGRALIEDPAADDAAKREALALYEEAKLSAPHGLHIGEELSPAKLEFGRAEALAALGRADEAIRSAERSTKALSDDGQCDVVAYFVERLGERLATIGRSVEAERLKSEAQGQCPIDPVDQ